MKILHFVSDWAISNLLWEVLILMLVTIFSLRKSLDITRILVYQNRDTRDNGLGTYFADRFVNVWNSADHIPLRRGNPGDEYALTFGRKARHWLNVIDDKIVELKLAESFQNGDHRSLKPIRNFTNRLVYSFVKFYLIYVTRDNPNYYRDQETQRAKRPRWYFFTRALGIFIQKLLKK